MRDRTTARVVGVLFIVASVAAVVGGTLLLPSVGVNYLVEAADHEIQVVSGASLEVVQAMAVIGIAVMLFPVLKRRNEGLALGFVGARTVEGVLTLAGTVSALAILTSSQSYGQPGVAGAEPLGDTLVAAREWSYRLGPMLMFGVSALILYTLLYRAELVPAWLSIWGFAGGALLQVRTVLEMYGREFSPAMQGLFAAPIGLNEMVLAVWLIVKGFKATASTAEPERQPAVVGG
ncbi:MAG: DUF4386 domain-containing protein [Actinobacteria bacterium]|nr:DUF4386 domain-containing protein [Actinomycetota bacterium]